MSVITGFDNKVPPSMLGVDSSIKPLCTYFVGPLLIIVSFLPGGRAPGSLEDGLDFSDIRLQGPRGEHRGAYYLFGKCGVLRATYPSL